jgi:hypothetical protein
MLCSVLSQLRRASRSPDGRCAFIKTKLVNVEDIRDTREPAEPKSVYSGTPCHVQRSLSVQGTEKRLKNVGRSVFLVVTDFNIHFHRGIYEGRGYGRISALVERSWGNDLTESSKEVISTSSDLNVVWS